MPAASRLLARLEAAIRTAPTTLEADCLKAECAAYLVRQGRSADVDEIVGALHRRYDPRPDVRISAWLGLVEGLQSFFRDMSPGAIDKIRRAHALSAAAGLTPMRALSAAWLAHMDSQRHDLPALAGHLGEALRLAAPDHHGARSRATLGVAQALHAATRADLAQPWYVLARQHANDDGDDATISALMFNMAVCRVLNARQTALSGSARGGEGRIVESAETAQRFEQLVGGRSLPHLAPLLAALSHSIEGRAQSALPIYEKELASGLKDGWAQQHAMLLADQAWVRMTLGQTDAALLDALGAQALIEPKQQAADRAPAHARLAQTFAGLGHADAADAHAALAAQAWRDAAAAQARVAETLSRLTPDGSMTV